MGFSCEIRIGALDLTDSSKGEIHYKLFGLGPSSSLDTEAPYRVEDFRSEVLNCVYGDRLKEAAQDTFRIIQRMAKQNFESLVEKKHCDTCTCDRHQVNPSGWSVAAIERLLSIDPDTITYLHGSY